MLNTLDDLRNLIADLPGPDEACRATAQQTLMILADTPDEPR